MSRASAIPTCCRQVADAPLPEPGRGDVRVRVLASGIEYTDVVIRRHLYPQTMRRRPPFVTSYDVVGEIDQLGKGVRDYHIGDRVADMTVLGSNAARRTLRTQDLTRVPADADAADTAALILSWTTARQLLHRTAGVESGQRVLVQGRPAPSARRCSCSAAWPGLSCGARRAASTRRWSANSVPR